MSDAIDFSNIKLPCLEEVHAELCRRSLFYFFCQFWDVIESDELHLNWHIEDICDEIQRICELVFDEKNPPSDDEVLDLLLNICPGTTKSTIVSIIAGAWCWTRRPDWVILCNTISESNALKFSLKFKDIVTSEKYRTYFPHIIVRRDSSAVKRIQNTLGGARRQYTTKGTIIGDHGHIRFDDDPESFEDAFSDLETERCINGEKSYATREKKNVRVPYMCAMQRLSSNDITAYLLKVKPNIKQICLPAWDNGRIYPPEKALKYVDGLLNPRHIGSKFLEKKKLELGDLRYLAEYGQDCDVSDGYMYTVNKTSMIEDRGISIAVCDPASDGDCYMATVFARIYGQKCYIKEIIYTQDGEEDTPERTGTISRNVAGAKKNKPMTFYVEKDGLGNTYAKWMKGGYGLVVPFAAPRGMGAKRERIFSKSNIISKFFVFLEQSPNMEYENAVNHLTTYKRVGDNKFVDFEDVLTSLAVLIEKNGWINFYT